MLNRPLAGVALVGAAALILSGCTENPKPTDNTTGAAAVLQVTSTADACTVSTSKAESGATTFTIKNDGTQTTEFYLLASDGLRIVAERENIAPQTSADLTVTLQPGDYFTACKPGMRGANVGETSFTVTGDPVELSAEDQELFDGAVKDYVNFVKNEVAELVPGVEELAKAYESGDDEAARSQFATIRVHYERIEPIAEALGVLDPRIDYREIDYLAEAELLAKDDPTFTQWLGFHRIEKDLWPPAADAVQPDGSSAHEGWEASTPEKRKEIADLLVADVNALYDAVHADDYVKTSGMDIATVSNGAIGLLEEVAVTKITGEEDWWSHTDLWDFQGNLEGSRIAFDLVAPIAERKGEDGKALVSKINTAFDELQAELAKYGNLKDGFVLYNTVDSKQQSELTARLDAVREPLSELTSVVLGVK